MTVRKDGGYAWVILASSFGSNYIAGVLLYVVGVIHAELLRQNQYDVTLTAWAGALYSSLHTLAGT